MSLIQLANGHKYEIETPVGEREGTLRQRVRKILPLTFTAEKSAFNDIIEAFSDAANTETMTLYYPDEKESATAAQLEGVANKVYEGYTIVGDITEHEVPGAEGAAQTYTRRLSIDMGLRLAGE